MGAARSEDDVIRGILGLPKRHHLGTIPMYQWIHLVLADKLAYDGCRLNLVSLRKTRFIQSHALFTGIYFLKRLFVGFLVFAGLRLLVLRQFSAFLPAVRRLRGAVLFHGLRSSSIWGFPFWLLWLTGQSSRPAFGRRLTFVR